MAPRRALAALAALAARAAAQVPSCAPTPVGCYSDNKAHPVDTLVAETGDSTVTPAWCLAHQPEVASLPFCDQSLPYEARAADLVSRLLPEEIGPQLTARNAPPIPRLGVPAYYVGTNAIHGITNGGGGGALCVDSTGRCVTIWPSGPSFGASFNATLFRLLGNTTGIEMRAMNNLYWGPAAHNWTAQGMDGLTSWGPTINLVRDPRWGRIQETASEDPLLNGVFAREITKGLQLGADPRYIQAAATLKHFAVYNLEDYHAPDGTHYTRENINNVVTQFDLADSYTPHFATAVKPVAQGGGGALSVMMAMNEVNGVPCLANAQLINMLKGWAGSPSAIEITSDGINMIDSMLAPEPQGHFYCPYHAPPCSRAEGVAAAVQAGCDIADGNEYQQTLITALQNGNTTLGDAQQRLYNSFLLRMRLGLFDPQAITTSPYWSYGAADVNTDAIRAENVAAAQQGMVLLQNPGAVLPFPQKQGSTLVIGYAGASTEALVSNYVNQYCPQGPGNGDCFNNIVQAMTALGENVTFSQGCTSAGSCPAGLIAEAAAAASAASVTRIVITLGLSQAQEAEQRDRQDIGLPGNQSALFAAVMAAAGSKPVAVVLVNGGPVSVPEVAASRAAIVEAFYPGPAGGQAIAEVLFGVANRFGKLPYSVPANATQFAAEVAMTDMNVGAMGRTYRYHGPGSPGGAYQWSFGYGLSYTSFALSWAPAPGGVITLTPASPSTVLTVRVANTGARDGDEVLQAYHAPNATSLAAPQPPFVPLRQLFSFERVAVPAGGSVTVPVNVSASDLILTLSDGTRKPVDGSYTIILSRGPGVGPELTAQVVLAGFY